MNTNLARLAGVTLALGCLIQGCGDDDEGGGTLVPITWVAGDLDPFDCPYVEPEAWVSREDHEVICGAGCEPFEYSNMFVACISENLAGFPPTIGGDAILCLTHPVSSEEYQFPTTGWGVLSQLCWGACTPLDGLVPTMAEECFELVPE